MCPVHCTYQFVRIYNNDNDNYGNSGALPLEAACPASHQINAPAYQISTKVIDNASNFPAHFQEDSPEWSLELRGGTVQYSRRTQNTVTDA